MISKYFKSIFSSLFGGYLFIQDLRLAFSRSGDNNGEYILWMDLWSACTRFTPNYLSII